MAQPRTMVPAATQPRPLCRPFRTGAPFGLRSRRNAANTASRGSPSVRTSTAHPAITPASSAVGHDTRPRRRISSMASMTRKVNRASAMTICSSSISNPSSSTGSVAMQAHLRGTALRRATA